MLRGKVRILSWAGRTVILGVCLLHPHFMVKRSQGTPSTYLSVACKALEEYPINGIENAREGLAGAQIG